MARKHYFKYRSLANLRFFLDILIYKRLYMANFASLNDPMEGAFVADFDELGIDIDTLKALRNGKDKWRICSLSSKFNNILMWAHYADSNKGCCLECSVLPSQNAEQVKVFYVSEIKTIDCYDADNTAKEVLSRKLKCWSYEDEIRFMKRVSSTLEEDNYLKVKIHKIYLGVDISRSDKLFYKQLINSIDGRIKVVEMERNDLSY